MGKSKCQRYQYFINYLKTSVLSVIINKCGIDCRNVKKICIPVDIRKFHESCRMLTMNQAYAFPCFFLTNLSE